ncbi:uncharacterized protein LOC115692310 isoform X2 [Syzygium oleosum]|uniref:uncharacterized protein LOC115692310 isoform X2 n=1 Tax=Syzygium oleosum TaxID=219896 RepID=UPI0024BB97EC|nr:uncharacterized protein LOC115692310 isoform X2 [Syzygium oleosum]
MWSGHGGARGGAAAAAGSAGRRRGDALETIHAAATAIASAENRVPQAAVQKKRWGAFWSLYWCFGSQKHQKRIGPAVLLPETMGSTGDAPATHNLAQPTAITLPFVAPPSSPASFLQSEPPSAAQSPAGVFSMTSISASMYSPSGPRSIFAIGPYAHETQLVSPPVFSTFTTEPSTAPFTPPPESVHLTTPSSPEVPFAQLLDPNLRNSGTCQGFLFPNYEFQSYQFSPGSPVGHLISPSSGISGSGTSSPFPGCEFAGGLNVLEFRSSEPPKLLNLDKLCTHEWGSRRDSGSLTPDSVRTKYVEGYPSDFKVATHPSVNKRQNGNSTVNNRVSFEIPTEDVSHGDGKLIASAGSAITCANNAAAERESICCELKDRNEGTSGATSSNEQEGAALGDNEKWQHHRHGSITSGSSREFKFANADGRDAHRPDFGLAWWTGETVVEESGNWSFPVIQPGVS